jgi:hypothetical protein
MKTFVRIALATCAFSTFTAPAGAAALKTGSTFTAIPSYARGTAIAYGNGVYLLVGSHGGAPGSLRGRFIKNGAAIGVDFPIQTNVMSPHFPRVAYSPDADGGAGAFLVTWSESDAILGKPVLHFRLVNEAHAGAFGDDTRLGIITSSEAGNAVAYSTVSKEFLVVAPTFPYDLAAVRVDNNGHFIASVNILPTADGERDPTVAYSPVTDEFLVVYTGWDNVAAFAAATRIKAGTGAVLQTKILLFYSAGTFISEVSYNSKDNTFLASWYSSGAYGRVIAADGSLPGGVIALSTIYSGYDALGLAYNPLTNTFMMVSHSNGWEDGAVELGSNGVPANGGFIATDAGGRPGGGNFYPKVAASTTTPDWLLSTAHNFETAMAQVITGTPTGPPPPPPCTVTPGSVAKTFFHVGGGDSIALTATTTSCPWTVKSNASWLTISSAASGAGNATVNYSAALNTTGTGRTGTMTIAGQTFTVIQSGVARAAVHDINGDGLSDLILRNTTTGDLVAWTINGLAYNVMGGFQLPGGASMSTVDPSWRLAGSGDLNGDGYADLVWQHTNGGIAMWTMQGNIVTSTSMLSIPTVGAFGWQIKAVGDVNGDGRADIIWQHNGGALAVWLMNGATVTQTLLLSNASGTVLGMPDPNWQIVGAGDLNRDGRADIIWQNQVTGGLGAWTMNGSVVDVMMNLSPDFINTDFKIRGVGDVNGDGMADLIWVRQSTGQLFVWCMNGFTASVYQGIIMLGDGTGNPAFLPAGWTMVGPG